LATPTDTCHIWGVQALPNLPALPDLPDMPDMPSIEMPDMPSMSMPDVPSLSMPSMSMPSLSMRRFSMKKKEKEHIEGGPHGRIQMAGCKVKQDGKKLRLTGCSLVKIFKDSTEQKEKVTFDVEFDSEEEAYSWMVSMDYGGAELVDEHAKINPAKRRAKRLKEKKNAELKKLEGTPLKAIFKNERTVPNNVRLYWLKCPVAYYQGGWDTIQIADRHIQYLGGGSFENPDWSEPREIDTTVGTWLAAEDTETRCIVHAWKVTAGQTEYIVGDEHRVYVPPIVEKIAPPIDYILSNIGVQKEEVVEENVEVEVRPLRVLAMRVRVRRRTRPLCALTTNCVRRCPLTLHVPATTAAHCPGRQWRRTCLDWQHSAQLPARFHRVRRR
jgi:hypothetical protein